MKRRRRRPAKKQSAVDAVGFLEEFLGRFEGESGNFRRSMEAELAHFLMSAGRVEAAVEICERLIEEFPAEPRGYCVLADIYLAEVPPALERALEVLEAVAYFELTIADILERVTVPGDQAEYLATALIDELNVERDQRLGDALEAWAALHV